MKIKTDILNIDLNNGHLNITVHELGLWQSIKLALDIIKWRSLVFSNMVIEGDYSEKVPLSDNLRAIVSTDFQPDKVVSTGYIKNNIYQDTDKEKQQ